MYALPLVKSLNTMMGTADKWTLEEATKIANAVKEKKLVNGPVDGIVDVNKDAPQSGSIVTIKDFKDNTTRDVKVAPGPIGQKTKQAEEIKDGKKGKK